MAEKRFQKAVYIQLQMSQVNLQAHTNYGEMDGVDQQSNCNLLNCDEPDVGPIVCEFLRCYRCRVEKKVAFRWIYSDGRSLLKKYSTKLTVTSSVHPVIEKVNNYGCHVPRHEIIPAQIHNFIVMVNFSVQTIFYSSSQ